MNSGYVALSSCFAEISRKNKIGGGLRLIAGFSGFEKPMRGLSYS